MSASHVGTTTLVRHTTEALLKILRTDLVPGTIMTDPFIKAAPPEDIAGITNETLILYLYRVIESPFLRNSGTSNEPVPGPPDNNKVVVRRDPLALDLYYLLIPGAPTTPDGAYLDTYDILGAATASMHDHGIVRLGDWVDTLEPEEVDIEFRVDFNRLDTSDLIRIWEAVQRPYRLSVSYVVRTLQIQSTLVSNTNVVSERQIQVT